jgi:glycosyltransferase involved in cell wall biosynthesis
VQRGLKFTRYLPAHGWRPLVLTVPENAAFPARDESLLGEVPPEAVVHRSPIREFYTIYGRITGRPARGPIDIETVQREGESRREKFVRAVRASVFIPDGRVGWMLGGMQVGRRIGEREQPRAIFATGPPFTAHWLGARLSRELEIPLVLDFRDPWTRANFYPRRPAWARRIDQRLERDCLLQATRIVTVNEQIRDELRGSVPELPPERFVVIPNGFDPADFAGVERRPSPRWTIAHVGSIFASRVPYTFLSVFEAWLEREPALLDEVRLRLVGRVCPEMVQRVSEGVLSRVVTDDGYLSHRESVQAMVDADVLLLLTNEEMHDPGMITGKLFEYLGAGRPILALASPGEASRILEETKAGHAVAPKDAAGIRALLEGLHREWKRCNAAELALSARDSAAVARYSRSAQAKQLAETLDAAITEARSRAGGPLHD